jgi:hypothetical protein
MDNILGHTEQIRQIETIFQYVPEVSIACKAKTFVILTVPSYRIARMVSTALNQYGWSTGIRKNHFCDKGTIFIELRSS